MNRGTIYAAIYSTHYERVMTRLTEEGVSPTEASSKAGKAARTMADIWLKSAPKEHHHLPEPRVTKGWG